MIDQKKNLEWIEEKFKNKNPKRSNSQLIRVALEKLHLIREKPELNNKLKTFYENDVFATGSKDIIIFVEVGRIKQ